MNDFKELKAQLRKLNGLQWTKKQQLKKVIQAQAESQRRLNKNMVIGPEGHPGARYVPLYAVQAFLHFNRAISRITKDLNKRKKEINELNRKLSNKTKRCIVYFKGRYLIEEPDWNGGKWTKVRSEATVWAEPEFFTTYYPDMELLEPTPEEIKVYDIRRKKEFEEIRIRREKRDAERKKRY